MNAAADLWLISWLTHVRSPIHCLCQSRRTAVIRPYDFTRSKSGNELKDTWVTIEFRWKTGLKLVGRRAMNHKVSCLRVSKDWFQWDPGLCFQISCIAWISLQWLNVSHVTNTRIKHLFSWGIPRKSPFILQLNACSSNYYQVPASSYFLRVLFLFW